MSRFRITVLTLQGRALTFRVSKYEIVKGDFIEFIDEVTKKKKRFHASRCEIEGENGESS
jgi:hypothetical protein